MSRSSRKKRKKHGGEGFGTPPGTLVADPDAAKPSIHIIAYGPEQFMEADIEDLHDLAGYVDRWPVLWVNMDGLGDVDTIDGLGRLFNLHHLALEDVLQIHQRPKVDKYTDQLFMVARMMECAFPLQTEQLSIFLTDGAVVTFQEHEGDCLDLVRERIRYAKGRIRAMGADYLAYSLLDAVVDFYFPTMDTLSETLERMEEVVLSDAGPKAVTEIQALKRDLLEIRRSASPLRDALNTLIRDGHPLITETTRLYLRDVQDHIHQIVELTETYREILSGLLDIHLSIMSNRMNDIMKVLTLIATMFIPLTFVVGVYGMNFNPEASPWNMPELQWYWGYPAALALMGIVAVLELVFFWRRGWIGSPKRSEPPKEPPRDEE